MVHPSFVVPPIDFDSLGVDAAGSTSGAPGEDGENDRHHHLSSTHGCFSTYGRSCCDSWLTRRIEPYGDRYQRVETLLMMSMMMMMMMMMTVMMTMTIR